MTLNMWIATLAWALLVVGFLNRRNTSQHVRFMLAGIFLDIALVLYLQVTRDAIQKAASFSLAILEQVHIGFSTVALLLYFPVLYFGFSLLSKGPDPKIFSRHKTCAVTAFIFRGLGFVFMFSMWKL